MTACQRTGNHPDIGGAESVVALPVFYQRIGYRKLSIRSVERLLFQLPYFFNKSVIFNKPVFTEFCMVGSAGIKNQFKWLAYLPDTKSKMGSENATSHDCVGAYET